MFCKNVELILTEAGSSRDGVIQARVYIPDVNLWNKVNEVYSNFFSGHKPVRSIVPTSNLHYGALIEIEVTAIAKK